MAKITFCIEHGSVVRCHKEQEVDTVADLGMAEGEWESMSSDERQVVAKQWALKQFEVHWKAPETAYVTNQQQFPC